MYLVPYNLVRNLHIYYFVRKLGVGIVIMYMRILMMYTLKILRLQYIIQMANSGII